MKQITEMLYMLLRENRNFKIFQMINSSKSSYSAGVSITPVWRIYIKLDWKFVDPETKQNSF